MITSDQNNLFILAPCFRVLQFIKTDTWAVQVMVVGVCGGGYHATLEQGVTMKARTVGQGVTFKDLPSVTYFLLH